MNLSFWRGQSRLKTGTSVVLSAAMVGFVVAAVSATGFSVHHVAANDGAVWLTDNSLGAFSRYIDPIQQLNNSYAVPPPGSDDVDILQNGPVVVAYDRAGSTLYGINPSAGALETPGLVLPGSDQVAFGGSVLAVMNSKGNVWAADVEQNGQAAVSALQFGATPLVTRAVAIAVSVDGTVYAATTSEIFAVPLVAGNEGTARPIGQLPPGLTKDLSITVVGDTPVVLDGIRHILAVPSSGAKVPLPYGTAVNAVLQQPGPVASTVLVATTQGLFDIPLSGAANAQYVQRPTSPGKPAAPVRLGECIQSAWGGLTGFYARLCSGSKWATYKVPGPPLADPVFRLNNGFVVLADALNGDAYSIANSPQLVVTSSDWQAILAQSRVQRNAAPNTAPQYEVSSKKPKASCPANLFARPGRATVLHMLDGDSDPGGGILMIDSLAPTSGPGFSLATAPDGQKVILTLGSGPLNNVRFKYTVIDGNYQTASATCTVTVANGLSHPYPFGGAKAPTLRVDSLGSISYQVLSNWRDYYGDPLSVTSSSVGSGTVSWTGDGIVTFNAPKVGADTTVEVGYDVADGSGAPVQAQFPVTILAAGDTTAYPAQTQPDAAEVAVGKPATISPLDNDIPGADPNTNDAKLALAGAVSSVSGLTVATDTSTGVLTVTALRAGVYPLTYSDSYGSAGLAEGRILIRAQAGSGSSAPVTVPTSVLLRGQNPSTVNVAAFDYDPSGDLLTVISSTVQASGPGGQTPPIQVGIVDGEYLRISAQGALAPNTQYLVDYQVTDGVTAPVEGQVDVTWMPEPDVPPVANTVLATVRVGDEVDVPVLNAVSDPSGEPVYLQPGSVTVSPPSSGAASIDGGDIRFAASPPAPNAGGKSSTPASATAATVTYVAEDQSGRTATGSVYLTINPRPSVTIPDSAPVPPEIDARVSSGGTVTIPIPTTSVDPDGDSVTLTGVGGSPQLGRILGVTADSIQYQAFPLSAGTDDLSYQVTDPFGLSGQATIRVGVTPPGQEQAPIAQPVFATGAPGEPLYVDVLQSALVPAGTNPNVFVTNGAGKVDPASGSIEVTAPDAGYTTVITYGLGYGSTPQSLSQVIVRGQKGYRAAPITVDAYPALPTKGAQSVSVNVLKDDYDPTTGTNAGLRVIQVMDPQAPANPLVFPIKPYPYTVAYQIADAEGGTAIGVVHLPGVDAGPHLAPGVQPIQVNPGSTTTADIRRYIADAHGPVRMLTKQIAFAPSSGLTGAVINGTQIRLAGARNYNGPGSVTVTVTDSQSLNDPLAKTASVSIPVEVGAGVPILRCPTIPLAVTEDGQPDTVDVAALCNAWTPNPTQAVTFAVKWHSQPTGVTANVEGGDVLVVQAGASATRSGTGQLVLTASDAEGTSAPVLLPVAVTEAGAPTMSPISLGPIAAGHPSKAVDVASYINSPLAHKYIVITGKPIQTSGRPATATVSGTSVTITPAASSHGPITFQVTVSDVRQTSGRPQRTVTGTISAQVLGKPASMGPLSCTGSGHQVTISWSAVANNGSPVQYNVTGPKTATTSGTSTILTGLTNGTDYSFTVTPTNAIGSGASATKTCQPVAAPGPPGPINFEADAGLNGTVTLSWAPSVPNDNTEQPKYTVSVSPGVVSARTTTATSETFSGLPNDVGPYTFTVSPSNTHGHGPSVTSQSIYSYSTPNPPTNVVATATQPAAGAATTAVVVTWTPPDCHDDQTCLDYTVTDVGGTPQSPQTVTGDSATFTLDNTGAPVTFTVTATNKEKQTSSAATSNSVKAISPPPQLTNISVSGVASTPTELSVSFTVPTAYPPVTDVQYTYMDNRTGAASAQMAWSNPSSGSGNLITGLTPNDPYTVTLSACNATASCSSPPQQASGTTSEYNSPNASAQANASSYTNGSATFSWGPAGNDPPGYSMFIQATGQANSTQGESGSETISSYGCPQSVSVTVNLVDGSGHQVSASNTAGTTTQSCPPRPTVTVSWGSLSGTCGTSDPSCTWLNVSWANFPSGSHTLNAYCGSGCGGAPFPTEPVSGSSGSFNNTYYVGYCGHHYNVYATIDNVTSNTIYTDQHSC